MSTTDELDEICRRIENQRRLEELLLKVSWDYYTKPEPSFRKAPRDSATACDLKEKPIEQQDSI